MIKLQRNAQLAPLTTFHVKATTAMLAEYQTVGELEELLYNTNAPRPVKQIGAGSNLLFLCDFPGTLLHSLDKTVSYETIGGDTMIVTAGAGVVMDDLCAETASRNLWGLENLSGIPGEAGAASVQNVGAYGVEAKDIIQRVTAYDTVVRDTIVFNVGQLEYGYRDSMFKQPANRDRYIILSVEFRLSRIPCPRLGYANLKTVVDGLADGREPDPVMVRRAVMTMRDSKLPSPALVGSAGSFFKNPVVDLSVFEKIKDENPALEVPHFPLPGGKVKIPAAWLIDRLGWKGRRVGSAAVWEKQPLVIVNSDGNATAAEIVTLENDIIDSVSRRFGITLSPEVEHVGSLKR